MKYEDWLAHFNPNHDPRTGKFTSNGSNIGLKNLKHAKTSNLDKWGSGPDTNILFITGYSGSGKSTTALSLARPSDTVIHLDGYSELGGEEVRNKKFNKYLDKHVPNWKAMALATSDGTGPMKRHSKEYWDIVDRFQKAVDSYGRDEYKKGNRVIVEGVQIADDWFAGDKSYYSGKPTIVLTTNPITSMIRAFDRDGRGGLLKGLANLDNAKEYIQWYADGTKRLNDLSKSANAKRGQQYISEFLKRYENNRL